MPRPIPENKLQEIIAAIGRYADGATAAQIAEALVPCRVRGARCNIACVHSSMRGRFKDEPVKPGLPDKKAERLPKNSGFC